MVFGLLACYISAPISLAPVYGFCARACIGALESLHMLHAAAIFRLRKLSTLMITIQIQFRRTASLSIFTNVSVTYCACSAACAAPINTTGACRASWRGSKEAPIFPPTRTVLLCYPTTLTIIIDTLGYQPCLMIIFRISTKYRVALQLLGGFVLAKRMP